MRHTAKSFAFSRIRAEVLAAVSAVPKGHFTTYGAIARHLEITARHVAFVLAALSGPEASVIPWHRVVSADGLIRSGSDAGRRKHRSRLCDEGVPVSVDFRVLDFETHHFSWPSRPDHPGIRPRGPYSDPSTPPLFKKSYDFGYVDKVLAEPEGAGSPKDKKARL